jgi:hypothetical protein
MLAHRFFVAPMMDWTGTSPKAKYNPKRGFDRLCSTKRGNDLVLRRAQAIDVAIWCALGHWRVARRTTPICAIVLLRTKAAFCLVYRGGGGCEYRARHCHGSLLGLSRIRKAQRVSTAFASTKMIEANRSQSSIRRMSGYVRLRSSFRSSARVCKNSSRRPFTRSGGSS